MIKLDEKNRKLLSALLNNCRNSDAKIGKEIGLSREVVSYRIATLEKEGVIEGYTADISFNKLGFSAYSLSVKLHNASRKKENKILENLKNNKKIVYLQKTLGKFDLIGTIIVKSIGELNKEVNEIKEEIGLNLKSIEIDAFLGDYDFMPSFFKKENMNKKEIKFLETESYKLDKEESKILELLVKNSRMTAVEMSKMLKISIFSIARKIKNLLKNKVILVFRPVVNMEKLGYHRYTLLINTYTEIENNLTNFCRNHKLIWDLGLYVGPFNYAIEIYAENNEQFKQTIEEIMNQFSNSIIDYETLIIIKELKHSYFFI